MPVRHLLQPALQIVARVARVGELGREPRAVRFVRCGLARQRAKVFLGARPFLLEALDAPAELVAATERRIALFGEHRDFAFTRGAAGFARFGDATGNEHQGDECANQHADDGGDDRGERVGQDRRIGHAEHLARSRIPL